MTPAEQQPSPQFDTRRQTSAGFFKTFEEFPTPRVVEVAPCDPVGGAKSYSLTDRCLVQSESLQPVKSSAVGFWSVNDVLADLGVRSAD